MATEPEFCSPESIHDARVVIPSPGLHPPHLLLCGPTAVGKSEVALLLAEKLRGEIVSVDSMQAYRCLDIGTAKPAPAERARVPHHLIDVVEVTGSFDVARFVCLALGAVADIQARGRLPILSGGTGLYFKALLHGLGEAPPADATLRAQLEKTTLPDLLRELAERDPLTFERIDKQNPRRLVRALEVIRLTGKPFSAQRADWKSETSDKQRVTDLFGLSRSAGDLRRRIDARVDDMFRHGLVAETEQLLKRGLAANRTAWQALGYRQVSQYLEGVRSLSDTVELVKIRTRQFAKRQLTWFRRQLQVKWVHIEQGQSAVEIAEEIASDFSSRPAYRRP